GSWGTQTQAGTYLDSGFVATWPNAKVGTLIKVLDIQHGLVRLAIRARRFEVPSTRQEATWAIEGKSEQALDQLLANTPPHEYRYVPGQVLKIPLDGGGELLLSGRVFARSNSFWHAPLEPKPNEMVLAEGTLIRDNKVLASSVGGAGASGHNPGVAIYVPKEGIFVFMLHPI